MTSVYSDDSEKIRLKNKKRESVASDHPKKKKVPRYLEAGVDITAYA